jgi:hypothetical protein
MTITSLRHILILGSLIMPTFIHVNCFRAVIFMTAGNCRNYSYVYLHNVIVPVPPALRTLK